MNSKNRKTISLLLGGFIALIILGCSVPVENNSNATPQNIGQTPTELIESTPTARPTRTQVLSLTPTPTEVRKSDEYYEQISQELRSNFKLLLMQVESLDGNNTNYLVDDGSYEMQLLKKYIGYYIELAGASPERLEGIDFEPFALVNDSGKNLDIQMNNIVFTKENLEILEESGAIISLSHPHFDLGASNVYKDIFPIIKKIPSYNANGEQFGLDLLELSEWGGIVIGVKDYKEHMAQLSEAFIHEYGDSMFSGVAEFKPNGLSFTLPVNEDGETVFSTIVMLPLGTTPQDIERYITKGNVAFVALFMNKVGFESAKMP